jgi:hypothetical protein
MAESQNKGVEHNLKAMQVGDDLGMRPTLPIGWESAFKLLKFDNAILEANFGRLYLENALTENRLALVLGASLFYVFFLWGQVIDPVHYVYTHAIRGLVFLPMVALLIVLMSLKQFADWMEKIFAFTLVWASLCLSVIYNILEKGWDYGSVGVVMLFGWAGSMLRVRFQYIVIALLVSAAVVMASMLFEPSLGLTTLGINGLCVTSSAIVAAFGIVVRELSERNQFLVSLKLNAAQQRVNDFEYGLRASNSVIELRRRIFLSYRRADSEATSGRIRDRLAIQFGSDSIFMDVDNVPIGVDFRDHIRAAIKASDLFLCVIGSNWLKVNNGSVHRLQDKSDPVRLEIEAAMEFSVPIIPVLIGKAVMPDADDLDMVLKPVTFLNAAHVDIGKDFHLHLDRLIIAIEKRFESHPIGTVTNL